LRGPSYPLEAMTANPDRPRKLVDLLTVVVLGVTIGVVGLAAAPAVLRAAGVGDRGERARHTSAPPASTVDPADPDNFLFEEEADDEPLYREPSDDPRWRGHDPLGDKRGKHARIGVTRATLRLFDEPSDKGEVTAMIRRGESVTILREAGDWLLVAWDGAEHVSVGWAKKNEIAVR